METIIMPAGLQDGFEPGRADPDAVERRLKVLQARLRSLPSRHGDAAVAEAVSEALAALGRARGAPGYSKLMKGDKR